MMYLQSLLVPLDDLRLDSLPSVQLPDRALQGRQRLGRYFLKGPIPLDWLAAASSLPGRALHVGVALWFRAGIERSNHVKLSQKLMRDFGIDRHAVYRGLRYLEDADLIEVDRKRGRCARVSILSVTPRDRASPPSPT